MNIRIALRAVIRNRLRACLTMLGVIIGVSSVIALVAVGDGAQAKVSAQVASLGTNLLQVDAKPPRVQGVAQAAGANANLTLADAQALVVVPGVAAVAPEMAQNFQVSYQRNNSNLQVTGTNQNYATIRKWPATEGRFLSADDVANGALVAVLGSTAASDLFGSVDPVGKTIQISSTSQGSSTSASSGGSQNAASSSSGSNQALTLTEDLTVIGVLQYKGVGGPTSSDDAVLVPITTARWRLIGSPNLRWIDVEAASTDQMQLASDGIQAKLDALHNITNVNQSPYHIQNQADILSTAEDVTSTFTVLLGAVAAISLLVGGIGIMNIMMVSVTERTREIGIRKALGATARIVLQQFLYEAVILSLMGGLLGIAAGYGVSDGLSWFFGWATLVAPKAVGLAFGFALAMGLIFGVYPAWRAAHLDPIEALHYE